MFREDSDKNFAKQNFEGWMNRSIEGQRKIVVCSFYTSIFLYIKIANRFLGGIYETF